MDFVHDHLADGRPFRVLTLVDNFSRVSPAIECDFSLNEQRVVAVLERLRATGLPQTIKVDNGSEFISKTLDAWAHRHSVKLEFSRPGKPTDNAFIEGFNGRLRQECLNQNWFISLADATETIETGARTTTNIGHTVRWANKRRANLWPIGNKPESIQTSDF